MLFISYCAQQRTQHLTLSDHKTLLSKDFIFFWGGVKLICLLFVIIIENKGKKQKDRYRKKEKNNKKKSMERERKTSAFFGYLCNTRNLLQRTFLGYLRNVRNLLEKSILMDRERYNFGVRERQIYGERGREKRERKREKERWSY